jgi:hypothetical protein
MKTWLMAVFALTVLSGCGSARNGSLTALFARGIGTATGPEAMDKTVQVLHLHQFELERHEGSPTIYIETRWRERTPFEDEQLLGISSAQIRAIMRGRPRSGTGMGGLYTIDLTIEQRVRTDRNSEVWTNMVMTDQGRAYAARIAEDLRRELNVGVRRF